MLIRSAICQQSFVPPFRCVESLLPATASFSDPNPVSLGPVFNLFRRTCQYLVGYREVVWKTAITDWVRFDADGDSFNENLVKEKCSEISGRWELKMAATVKGGGKLSGGWKGREGKGEGIWRQQGTLVWRVKFTFVHWFDEHNTEKYN